MVNTVDPAALARYLASGDPILRLLEENARGHDPAATSHAWLLDSPPKRMIYASLYGDLLTELEGLRVLDVGGGYSSLTRVLAARHDYSVLELFAHEDHAAISAIDTELGGIWLRGDWYRSDLDGSYDVIVANDLFPNVDQRLGLFLDRYLPLAEEVRLSLTYYDEPRFYETRRVDADEILFVLAWNAERVANELARYESRLVDGSSGMPRAAESVFANGRGIHLVTLRGG